MSSDKPLTAKCPQCGSEFSAEQLLGMVVRNVNAKSPPQKPSHSLVPIQCANCTSGFYIQVAEDEYGPFCDVLEALEDQWEEDLWKDLAELEANGLPPFETTTENLSLPLPTAESSKSTVGQFKEQIKKIDKNLDPEDRTPLIRDTLVTMIDEPSSDLETCLNLVKREFGLTARDIEAFRKDLNEFKAQRKQEKSRQEYQYLIENLSVKPKELSEAEKQEALAYLQDPNLIQNISADLSKAGEIVGEETNKMMLYFSAVSRKFKKPISLVIFGKSSSGKSYLANAIERFVPPEDKMILSSSSAQAFNYLGDRLKHKFILIQEWEGMEKILPTIRLLQSEGKLSRLVTIQDPDDKAHKTEYKCAECPCSVVVTTTQEGIHDENSTRIFELYADETVAQTQKVVQNTLRRASIKHRGFDTENERIFNLHQNVQRVLEPIEVDIPYADHLSFPASTTRNRRDSERFVQLIKTVSFLRQKQKKVNFYNGIKYIEADLYDYEIAYKYGIPVISATLDQISDRAKNVLRVCCDLMDEMKAQGVAQPWFSVTQIQEKAPALGLEFNGRPGRTNLYKQLDALTEYEYLELHQIGHKGRKSYTVIFNYARDLAGNIINISSPSVKEITTPDELRQKLSTKI